MTVMGVGPGQALSKPRTKTTDNSHSSQVRDIIEGSEVQLSTGFTQHIKSGKINTNESDLATRQNKNSRRAPKLPIKTLTKPGTCKSKQKNAEESQRFPLGEITPSALARNSTTPVQSSTKGYGKEESKGKEYISCDVHEMSDFFSSGEVVGSSDQDASALTMRYDNDDLIDDTTVDI